MLRKDTFKAVVLIACALTAGTSCAVSQRAVREAVGQGVSERERSFAEDIQDRFDWVNPELVKLWLRPLEVLGWPPKLPPQCATPPPLAEDENQYAVEVSVVRIVTHDDIRLVEGGLHSSALSTNAEVYRAAVMNIGNLTLDTRGEELEWTYRWGISRPQVHVVTTLKMVGHENKPAMFADLWSLPCVEKPGCAGVMAGTRVLFMVFPGRDDRSVDVDLAFWSVTAEKRARTLGPLSFDVGRPEVDFQGFIAELQTELDEWIAVARRVPDGGYLFVFLKISRFDDDAARILSSLDKVRTPVYRQPCGRKRLCAPCWSD